MESDVQPNNEQNMDPMEYLNSISADSNSNGSGAQGTSGTMPITSKNKKWPIILLIVLVVVLIVVWLVVLIMTKNAPDDGNDDADSVTSGMEGDELMVVATLTCDKALSGAELSNYDTFPQFGKRNYFLVFDENGLSNIAQYTELSFVDEADAIKARDVENRKNEDYYMNKLGLTEDPFSSVFQHLEGERSLNIFFRIEKSKIDLSNSERFMLPQYDNLSVEDAKEFYEGNGYSCADLRY